MTFTDSKYETNNSNVISLRTDEDLVPAMGAAPTGAETLEIHGIVNGNRSREFGVHPRGVTTFQVLGTAPLTFKRYKFIPVLTQTVWNSAAYNKDAALTVGSETWTVQSRVEEALN